MSGSRNDVRIDRTHLISAELWGGRIITAPSMGETHSMLVASGRGFFGGSYDYGMPTVFSVDFVAIGETPVRCYALSPWELATKIADREQAERRRRWWRR